MESKHKSLFIKVTIWQQFIKVIFKKDENDSCKLQHTSVNLRCNSFGVNVLTQWHWFLFREWYRIQVWVKCLRHLELQLIGRNALTPRGEFNNCRGAQLLILKVKESQLSSTHSLIDSELITPVKAHFTLSLHIGVIPCSLSEIYIPAGQSSDVKMLKF